METKSFYANVVFVISALMLCVAVYLFCCSRCGSHSAACNNGTHGMLEDVVLPDDESDAITSGDASTYFNANAKKPYGAWIGKSFLLDILFKKDIYGIDIYNGVHVFLGSEINGKDTLNCFMIRGGKEAKGTNHVLDTAKYYKLDAMCPNYCNGLTHIELKK